MKIPDFGSSGASHLLYNASGGRPLDPRARAFMESRFQACFEHVRVHTGPAAAVMVGALSARAFTLGPNILFGPGQYSPDTPVGVRLLAHELAHVVQQGPEPLNCGAYAVGTPSDPLEREADLVAEKVLTAGPLPRITTNAPRLVRRAVIVNGSSAKVTVSSKGVLPNVHVDPIGLSGFPFVVAHLTKNFMPNTTTGTPGIGTAAFAWSATGEVGVTAGPSDAAELAKWNFGFIQFQKVKRVNLFYAGNVRSDGGIAIQVHLPPALASTHGRDCATSTDANAPWMFPGTTGDKTFNAPRGVAVCPTGDHPQLGANPILMNTKTGFKNFLFHLIDDREFVSVFSASDPAGNFQHFAHFEWSVLWEFRFIWRPGTVPLATREGSTSFKMGSVVKGPPTKPEIQSFLNNLGSARRLGTPDLTGAIRAAVMGPPNRVDTEERFGIIPPNFFQF